VVGVVDGRPGTTRAGTLTMIRCSFCEQPLVCKACGQPVRPSRPESHLAVYQPDMAVTCPSCQELVVCKACGFTYGEEREEEEKAEG
jgi:hypothetical protein